MIVRIATEGQYELPDSDREELNQLDNRAVAAGERGEEAAFGEAFQALLTFVREHGRPVGEGEVVTSDVIFPPPDASLREALAEFSGEGLIPD